MDETFLQLKELLAPFGITRFYTDGWGAYRRHLDPSTHTVGKQHTQKGGVAIELITFPLLSESQWFHEAHQLNCYTTSQVNTGSSVARTTPWATSTPRLKPSRAIARFQDGKASGRRAEAKPKPCTRPKSKLTTQRCDGARWRPRFSRATQAIDAGMTDSTKRSG